MTPLPALLLAASAAPAYPAKAVFGAFEQACRRIGDFPATAARAKAKGWAEVPPADEPHLAKLVALGMAEAPEGGKTGVNLRREVKGRTLYLVLSRYQDAEVWGNGCRLYDFAAPAGIAQRDLEAWMKAPSAFRQAQEGVLSKLTWRPGWPEKGGPFIGVEAAYIPGGSPLTEQSGLLGLVLVAEASGKVAR